MERAGDGGGGEGEGLTAKGQREGSGGLEGDSPEAGAGDPSILVHDSHNCVEPPPLQFYDVLQKEQEKRKICELYLLSAY